MTEITIPTKAVWAQMLIDHYSELNTTPTTTFYETIAFIIRDLAHYMIMNGPENPKVAIATVQIGITAHMADIMQEGQIMSCDDMIEQFKDLLQKARNPVVPAGFEKFLPGAHN